MGLWPAPAPTGYLNEKRVDRKGYVMIDPQRAPIVKQMFEKVAYEGWSGRKVYHWLKFDMNFRSPTSNKVFTLSNVYRLLQLPFYYGVFEYPAKSGNWYTGKHQPIITRELFEKAREQLVRSEIKQHNKEFAFTRLITCGHCGSSVTANERIKKLRDGSSARYVYYGCTRGKDIDCKGGYLREDALIEQLIVLINNIDMDLLSTHRMFHQELDRFNKFRKSVLGVSSSEQTPEPEVEPKTYAKYILQRGSDSEKRLLMSSLRSRIFIKDKCIGIEIKQEISEPPG